MLWTEDHAANLKEYLETHQLPKGLGTEESACSIAAINLAINGKLTDNIPDCMSALLGKAIIKLQDAMPDDMRNSVRYRAMLLSAPGTGRDKEQERLAVLMDWMWGTVLPQVQPLADERGFGDEWRRMCDERTTNAASAARAAAYAPARAASDAATAAAYAYAATAAAYAADAYAAASAAFRAAFTASAASAARDHFWQTVDPIGVLERMIEV